MLLVEVLLEAVVFVDELPVEGEVNMLSKDTELPSWCRSMATM